MSVVSSVFKETLPVEGGTMRLMQVITTWKSVVNLPLYSGPMFRPAISDRHLSVTFLNSCTSRNYRQTFRHPCTHPGHQVIDDLRFKDVSEGNPVQEP